jgi:hypothetical protein
MHKDRLRVKVQEPGKETTVHGISWLDRQWGNFFPCMGGWDWFCFQMDDRSEYNLYAFRKWLNQDERDVANVWTPDKTLQLSNVIKLERLDWWKSPRSGKSFVTRWKVTLPGRNETFDVTNAGGEQELSKEGQWDIWPPSYWEGGTEIVRHNPDGTTTHGVGNCEQWPRDDPSKWSQPTQSSADLKVESFPSGGDSVDILGVPLAKPSSPTVEASPKDTASTAATKQRGWWETIKDKVGAVWDSIKGR